MAVPVFAHVYFGPESLMRRMIYCIYLPDLFASRENKTDLFILTIFNLLCFFSYGVEKRGEGGVARGKETACWWEKDLMLHTSSLCGTVFASFSPKGRNSALVDETSSCGIYNPKFVNVCTVGSLLPPCMQFPRQLFLQGTRTDCSMW